MSPRARSTRLGARHSLGGSTQFALPCRDGRLGDGCRRSTSPRHLACPSRAHLVRGFARGPGRSDVCVVVPPSLPARASRLGAATAPTSYRSRLGEPRLGMSSLSNCGSLRSSDTWRETAVLGTWLWTIAHSTPGDRSRRIASQARSRPSRAALGSILRGSHGRGEKGNFVESPYFLLQEIRALGRISVSWLLHALASQPRLFRLVVLFHVPGKNSDC